MKDIHILIDKINRDNKNAVIVGINGSGKSSFPGVFRRGLEGAQDSSTLLVNSKKIETYSPHGSGSELQKNIFHIWANLISGRKLIIKNDKVLVKPTSGDIYDFENLSFGEKAVYYYTAQVLKAEPLSYIIVRAPESYLHSTVCSELWDILERRRADCRFIYITYNLSFAESRSNSILVWSKSFTHPGNWDYEIVHDNSVIPKGVVIEMLGSKKDIMFCEGTKSSIDCKLYSMLFDQYTVIPAGGHFDVENYTEAYNSNGFGHRAIGIIDRDRQSDKNIKKLKKINIYTIGVNEVENIICSEIVLKAAIKRYHSSRGALKCFKRKFFKKLDQTKEHKATEYANVIMNNTFRRNMLSDLRDISTLKEDILKLIEDNIIEKEYAEYIKTIDKIIKNKDFGWGIRFCNLKKIM